MRLIIATGLLASLLVSSAAEAGCGDDAELIYFFAQERDAGVSLETLRDKMVNMGKIVGDLAKTEHVVKLVNIAYKYPTMTPKTLSEMIRSSCTKVISE